MFETEVSPLRLTEDLLPPEVLAAFARDRGFSHLAPIKWEEHCTECAWPACYTTCDLYSPRADGNCRRTIDGFAALAGVEALGIPLVRVRFKRWANLTARSTVAVHPVDAVVAIERRVASASGWAARLPFGAAIGRPGLPARAVRRWKDRLVAASAHDDAAPEPTCLVLEVYNPGSAPVDLSLDVAPRPADARVVPFKRLISLQPGFQRVRLPFDEIRPHLAGAREVDLQINPNILTAAEEGLTLFLGLMGFAREAAATIESAPAPVAMAAGKKVKVVIWDLDNTLWDGTLIEEGPGKVRLRPGIREVIEALDGRGIVNSVASKNHAEDALAELERLGLAEYFVFPEISWGRKSEAVTRIIKAFNVGADTVAFVDDQPFEREEVRSANPQVRLYRHDEVAGLLDRAEFDVPVTAEARSRRGFYQNQAVRQQAMQQVLDQPGSDYLAFLKRSNIRIVIDRAGNDQLDRVHELVQRTNQMNFSGHRYSKEDLRAMLADDALECFLVDAEDDFGKYGTIGFAAVRRGPQPLVQDLAFSCRIQAKRVEHAVLVSLMAYYAAQGGTRLDVFYRGTEKNAPVARVFDDLAYVETSREGADVVYGHALTGDLPVNEVIQVRFPAMLAPAK
ncbi:MAG: HAD-IIIC family phosphatase [Sphingomonadales bacterium]|nr:HAD-IIIC family phosphatase [Sphingomonadales bacterium]